VRSHLILGLLVTLLATASGIASSLAPATETAMGGGAPLPAHPERVVSVTLSTDEMLLALVPEARILALSTFADDPLASNVRREARRVAPRVSGDAEALLALEPDLVVTNPFASADAMALLERSRVPVLRVPAATSIADVEEGLRTLADALGARARAEEVIAAMRAKLDRVADAVDGARRPRAILYTTGGWVAGAGTLPAELLALAGADNAAALSGIAGHAVLAPELLLALDPEVVIVVDYRADGRARELFAPPAFAEDPVFRSLTAVRTGRVHALDPRRVLSASHHAADGALELARVLHPERFE
jgi:iron complex transport system substrate-binding protein